MQAFSPIRDGGGDSRRRRRRDDDDGDIDDYSSEIEILSRGRLWKWSCRFLSYNKVNKKIAFALFNIE